MIREASVELPEVAIRFRRAAFNRALREADLGAIGTLLMPDAVLVTGTDSAVLAGRREQLRAWKREFTATNRTTYVRMPGRIEPSAINSIASEYGDWKQVGANERLVAHGSYVAKWRQVQGDWMIEAEIFLTLA